MKFISSRIFCLFGGIHIPCGVLGMGDTKLLYQLSQQASKYLGPLPLVEVLVSNPWHLSVVWKTEVWEQIDFFTL
jgi:hypothetical protein